MAQTAALSPAYTWLHPAVPPADCELLVDLYRSGYEVRPLLSPCCASF